MMGGPYQRMLAMIPKVRLFVDDALSAGGSVPASPAAAHYLGTVMRMAVGDAVLLFNGRDGEWRAEIAELAKGRGRLAVIAQARPQAPEPDLWLAFAPLKKGPMDVLATKATELGAARLLPVLTRRTNASRVNVARLAANAREAAEQCGRLTVPAVAAPVPFDRLLAGWPAERRLIVPDETGGGVPIAAALAGADRHAPCAILTGPEGGWAADELDALSKLSFATRVGLGPRILRAETAALAALACWQALVGDGAEPPAAGR